MASCESRMAGFSQASLYLIVTVAKFCEWLQIYSVRGEGPKDCFHNLLGTFGRKGKKKWHLKSISSVYQRSALFCGGPRSVDRAAMSGDARQCLSMVMHAEDALNQVISCTESGSRTCENQFFGGKSRNKFPCVPDLLLVLWVDVHARRRGL